MNLPPNKSPEPTAVGACRSAIAVHVASRRWFSFFSLVCNSHGFAGADAGVGDNSSGVLTTGNSPDLTRRTPPFTTMSPASFTARRGRVPR